MSATPTQMQILVKFGRVGNSRQIGEIYNLSVTFCSVPFSSNRLAKQDAQLSQRDRAAGCVIVFAKSRRLELGDNILRTLCHLTGLSSTTVI